MHGEEEKAEAAILAAFVHWPCATARAWTNSYLHHFIDAAIGKNVEADSWKDHALLFPFRLARWGLCHLTRGLVFHSTGCLLCRFTI